jgi:hypothetical protein
MGLKRDSFEVLTTIKYLKFIVDEQVIVSYYNNLNAVVRYKSARGSFNDMQGIF